MAKRECGTCGNGYEDEVGIDSDYYCPSCQEARELLTNILRREHEAETLMNWVQAVAEKSALRALVTATGRIRGEKP